MTLREVAQGVADFIAADEVFRESGNISVVVEDKASVGYEIANALGSVGVCVLVATPGFRIVEGSPILQGTLEMQISCYEHPELNRADLSTLTAQGTAERLAQMLHYRTLPCLANKIIFKNFNRDDVEEANIVRMNFESNTLIGWTPGGAVDADTTTTEAINSAKEA